jgi:rhodanese-related sulfurtransferase
MDRLIEFITNHWVMVTALLIVTVLLIQDLVESLFNKSQSVSPTGAVALMNNDKTLVIDVREPNEYASEHIERARHIPLGKLDERLVEIEDFKQEPVIVTCQSGTRAPIAGKKLTKQGFEHVYVMKGGMLAWTDAKLPVTRKRKNQS